MEKTAQDPIPGRLNIFLAVVSCSIALALLYCASHTDSIWLLLVCSVVFSFVNNTVFSLLHECVHGVFHENRLVNDWFGRVTAAFFPTAYTFQRICHLGHHRRNRSDVEMFDYYYPEDNKLLKYSQWYGILTGIYWLLSPLGCLVYLLWPRAFQLPQLRDQSSVALQHTSADAMLSGFDQAPQVTVRLEILLTIVLQIAFIYGLGLTAKGWWLCYGLFGFNWSSLQYTDHAWSAKDSRHGAWNLEVNRIVRYLFLNYHHHRAHHEYPHVPWLHLPKYVDVSEPRPSFLRVYLSMWRGPRPFAQPPPEMEEFVRLNHELIKRKQK